jgi:ParB family chromosome partitioning protein
MSKKPRGLGAGFASLLSHSNSAVMEVHTQDELTHLSPSALVSGRFQPRTQWDDANLAELAESIRSQGIIQPIVVRSIGVGQYEIIAGERRWRAAKLAGLSLVPTLVRQMDDQTALAIALIENIQRENLTAIEEARAIRQLADSFSLTHEQIAQTLGRSREAVSNLLRLLKLEVTVQEAVLDGQLSAGHARCLVSLPESEQQRLAQQAMSLQWSVRELEQVVRQLTQPKVAVNTELSIHDNEQKAQWGQRQQALAQALGLPVKLSMKASGKGKLEIQFPDENRLSLLIEKLSH